MWNGDAVNCKILILTTTLLGLPAWAGPREDIAKAYQRSSKAMSLKFVDGVHSLRAREFKLSDPDSVNVSEQIERVRLEQVLSRALKVEETSNIVSFSSSGSTARCRAHFVTRLTMVDELSRKQYQLILDTDCEDDWVLQSDGWKVKNSRVLRQEAKRIKS